MKARHRKRAAVSKVASSKRNRVQSADADATAVHRLARAAGKHVGKVQGDAARPRADRKPRRAAGRSGKGFGGGTAPAANDNSDLETRLRNEVGNYLKGSYPAWRKDIANTNTLIPLPGGKK